MSDFTEFWKVVNNFLSTKFGFEILSDEWRMYAPYLEILREINFHKISIHYDSKNIKL